MNLVLFDIDGTLAHTAPVFDPFYFEALAEQAGEESAHVDLDAVRDVTDEGIAADYLRARGVGEVEAGVARMKTRYLERMRAHRERAPMVPGAAELVGHLVAHPDWFVGVATGNWVAAAYLKLECAGVDVGDAPLAGCDGRPERTAIMEHAHDLCRERHGGAFGRIVYVGDASWDVRASRRLGWNFVGVAEPGSRLLDEGASHAFPDLTDRPALVAALASSAVPR